MNASRPGGTRTLVMTAAFAALACGCDSEPDDVAGAAADDAGSDAATGPRSLAGGFRVTLIEPVRSTDTPATSLIGNLYDAPQPPTLPVELELEEGDCRLMVPKRAFCDPACSDGVCTDDDVCTAFADPQDVGTVRVQGLGGRELALSPVGPRFVYQPSVTLPNPPCEVGAQVRLEAEAFTLEAPCIAPLELTVSAPVAVMSGAPVALSWTPLAETDIARVQIVLDIAHHGGQKGEIVCDVPDTGAFEIPEPLITRLVSLGLAGYPTIVVSRVARASAPEQPDVTLILSSPVERAVDTGVTSCGDIGTCPQGMTCDEACPPGTTCQPDLVCR